MKDQLTEYLDIIKNTANVICIAKKNAVNPDPHQIAELYGIYYNAFAGALRCGRPYKKEMDIDGYPKITITIGNNTYPCRDIALRDILGEDYERLTQYPYEDTSASHVIPYEKPIHTQDEYKATPVETPQNMDIVGNGNASNIRAEQKKEEAIIRRKNRELQKDARGFQYDPDYDHYYSDRLPEMLKELDSTRRICAARISCIALSCAGILLSLTFL